MLHVTEILYSYKNIKSILHLDRYIKLIKYYIDNPCIGNQKLGAYEKHHILPRKMWPEYIKESWNLVIMPTKAHYLAHYLLYKAFKNASCVFAFNQMQRISKKQGKSNCRLYQAARHDLAVLIRELNTGRKMSLEIKQAVSARFKGTNLYRNIKNGTHRRFVVGQQLEGWEPFQTGRIRTQQSKDLMRQKMQTKQWQYNPETKEIKFDDVVQAGFIKGYPEWLERDFMYLTDSIWIHNQQTKENMRVPKTGPLPDGYVIGRYFDNIAFKKINNGNMKKVLNIQSKKYELINKSDFDPYLHSNISLSINKVVLYKYHNKVYITYNDLVTANPHLPVFPSRNAKGINDFVVPKPHLNMTQERRIFCKNYAGCKIVDLALRAIPLLDYEYNRDEIYVDSIKY
jgi:hypothetical protein